MNEIDKLLKKVKNNLRILDAYDNMGIRDKVFPCSLH